MKKNRLKDYTYDTTTQAISYIPYGEVFVEQQSGGWSSPYLFNAKELDSETGLYYYGARYLDPSDAMWLSVDLLWEKYVGMTPYQYCMVNPVKLVDVDGKIIKIPMSNGQTICYQPGITKITDTDDEYGKQIIGALNLLVDKGSDYMNLVISELSNSNDVNISFNKSNFQHGNHYDQSSGVLEWDPSSGFISDSGIKRSPSTSLYHELGHSYLAMKVVQLEKTYNQSKGLKKFISKVQLNNAKRRCYGNDWKTWGFNGDENVIKEFETDAAINIDGFVPTEEHPYSRDSYPGGHTYEYESKVIEEE